MVAPAEMFELFKVIWREIQQQDPSSTTHMYIPVIYEIKGSHLMMMLGDRNLFSREEEAEEEKKTMSATT